MTVLTPELLQEAKDPPIGQPQKITLTAGRVSASRLPDDDPRRYECTIISAGKNLNGWVLPVEVLAAAAQRFTGAPVQIDHPGWWDPAQLSTFAGTIEQPLLQDDSLVGSLRVADTPHGELLARIFDAWLEDLEEGLDVADIGLSAVLWLTFDYVDEKYVAQEIHLVESVDAVLHPAAGGRVERIVNSLQGVHHLTGAKPLERSTTMPEEVSFLTDVRQDSATNAEVSEHTSNGGNNTSATPPPPQGENPGDPIDLDQALQALQRVSDRMEQLTGQVDRLTGFVAEQEADRTVTGMGQAPRDQMNLRMGRTGIDQIEIALNALMEGRHPPDGVPPLTGIRELYMLLSGDYELTGRYHPDRVYLANVNSSTMAGLVANALNKTVVNVFQTYPRWWEPIVVEMDFSTLQDARWITLGGIGELPTVGEGSAYTELTWDDNTETAAFVKKGGYLGLTIEAIDKDDTRRLRMAPQALAQAAWLTLSKSVSSIFTSNSGVGPDLADSTALFDASRGNVGSTALSYSAWIATRLAMRKFTELNSGERLGALTAPRYLLVPPDLEINALIIMASEHDPDEGTTTSYEAANPFAEGEGREARLRSARDRVIVVDLWTETADWAAVADPRLYPSIAIGYRYGRTPEIFSVASPTAGLMFSNDVMPVKVRFFYATGPTDWRGLYKHNP